MPSSHIFSLQVLKLGIDVKSIAGLHWISETNISAHLGNLKQIQEAMIGLRFKQWIANTEVIASVLKNPPRYTPAP